MNYEEFVQAVFKVAEEAMKSIHEERNQPLPEWMIIKHAAEKDAAQKRMDAVL